MKVLNLRVLAPVAALAGAVSSAPAHAVAAADMTTMLTTAETLLGTIDAKLLVVGGIIIGLACIGVGIKWIKGTVFS